MQIIGVLHCDNDAVRGRISNRYKLSADGFHSNASLENNERSVIYGTTSGAGRKRMLLFESLASRKVRLPTVCVAVVAFI
jgi:hypothetical protein